MLPLPEAQAAWTETMALAARERFRLRRQRVARVEAERAGKLARESEQGQHAPHAKQAVIRAAIERAKSRAAGVESRYKHKALPRIDAEIAAIDAPRAAAKDR